MNANFKNEIQTFGRSLLLPIAVLAPVGMIMGISSALGQSYMIDKLPYLGNDIFRAILSSLGLISSVVFNNIPLLEYFLIGWRSAHVSGLAPNFIRYGAVMTTFP